VDPPQAVESWGTDVKLGRTTPILRIFDVARAREFYLGFLGFSVDWEHRFSENHPLYLQISRGDCVLHLSEHHGDGTPGTVVLIETQGIDELHEELRGRDYRYYKPHVEDTDWGARVMSVLDPFGNRLTFTERRA
jgi:catechol 2,3-dioxygenase-like lactoylglutathione lyase family enzyme